MERVQEDGRIRDEQRIEYIRGNLYWIAKAIEEGTDIRGYYVWSLLDNWEWRAGFESRFGLVHVDFDTEKRTVRTVADGMPGLPVPEKWTGKREDYDEN